MLKPILECYWVLPGHLLAGEYPGAKDESEARNKLASFVEAGIDALIDLTEEGEHGLRPYAQLLGQVSPDRHVRRIRLPIPDGWTTNDNVMNEILDSIDRMLAQGRRVFVHCWGGHGRTGMTLGCYLVRHGETGVEALATVKRLHGGMADGWKPSPETEAQREVVQEWAKHDRVLAAHATRTDQSDRVRGCMLGGAVGDALGAPVEFMSWSAIQKDFGHDGIQEFAPAFGRIGAITDDTQMTMFTVEGLIRAHIRGSIRGICDPKSVVHHAYLRWLKTQLGRSIHPLFKEPFDGWLIKVKDLHKRRAPGNTCLSALYGDQIGTMMEPLNNSKGCGTVMRVAPVGLLARPGYNAFTLGCEVGALTHGHPSGYLAGGHLAELIAQIMQGKNLRDAIEIATTELKKWDKHEECLEAVEQALALAERGPVPPKEIESLGGAWVAEEALAISIYCALLADDFAHGVRLAVNHSGDSDSTGAITGNILGALWGEGAIPSRWLDQLELRSEIEMLADDAVQYVLEDEQVESEKAWERYPGW